MGMSTRVVGFRPKDAQWEKMAKIWRACAEAGVVPPVDVSDFFEDEEPDENGVKVPIGKAQSEWRGDMHEGIEVDITKLPPGVKIIRFYNSW